MALIGALFAFLNRFLALFLISELYEQVFLLLNYFLFGRFVGV